MAGPYNIPRNYKGENKILFIFSNKGFICTAVGGFIGVLFYYLFKMLKLTKIGLIVFVIFAGIGFIIGTFKVPEITRFEITKKTGGENIDQVIMRWIKFKQKRKRIYVYKENEGEQKNG